mmetsp:Transcript_18516/g.63103  ORF Transcript_18516/g.63103 Transcript_18516/m.63103 type:complete len:138 (-) Transcript_18516:568-981(-)
MSLRLLIFLKTQAPLHFGEDDTSGQKQQQSLSTSLRTITPTLHACVTAFTDHFLSQAQLMTSPTPRRAEATTALAREPAGGQVCERAAPGVLNSAWLRRHPQGCGPAHPPTRPRLPPPPLYRRSSLAGSARETGPSA